MYAYFKVWCKLGWVFWEKMTCQFALLYTVRFVSYRAVSYTIHIDYQASFIFSSSWFLIVDRLTEHIHIHYSQVYMFGIMIWSLFLYEICILMECSTAMNIDPKTCLQNPRHWSGYENDNHHYVNLIGTCFWYDFLTCSLYQPHFTKVSLE